MANRKTLLVEGTNDEHVVKHICDNYGIPPRIVFKTHDGVEHPVSSIPTSINSAGDEGEAVGILVDADENAQNRWQSIRSRIIPTGYQDVPDHPQAGGIIIEPPTTTILPPVGVWIMPDNQAQGILEDFLRFLIPVPNPLLEHAQRSIATIPDGQRLFRTVDEPKALIHTWLAWTETPGRPFGTAITARFLDPDVRQAAVCAEWLQSLFFGDGEMG